MDLGLGISSHDFGVAGRVVKMPVGVDDRRYGLTLGLRIAKQLVAMRGVTPGIDQDQPLRRVQEDAVPVRPLARNEAARNHLITKMLFRLSRFRRAANKAQRNQRPANPLSNRHDARSEEHTSQLQSLIPISYA